MSHGNERDSRPAEQPAPESLKSRTITETAAAVTDDASAAHSPTPQASAEALPPRDRSRYEVRSVHGQGGLGRVLLAYDKDLRRLIAIKELLEPKPRAEARFVREAWITARLEHPAIVPVHDAGRFAEGDAFYTMKLVAGSTFKEALARATDLRARLELLPNLVAVADAIAYAHSKRVIHRDLKPSNVLVGEYGETVLIDWGLAKDLADSDDEAPDAGPYRTSPATSDGVTVAGEVVGTPAYMSPEQARGEEVDEATDIYSLGAMLYELVTGKRPFWKVQSGDIKTFLEAVREQAPEPVENASTESVPRELAAIVERAMARKPESRYESARELVADLRRFQSGQLVSAHRYSAFERAGRFVARHKVSFALVLVACAVYGAVTWQNRAARRKVVDERVVAAGALLEKARSESEAVEAFRAESFAAFDANEDNAEELWQRTLARSAAVDDIYRDAAQTIEAAFALDPERADVRAELARVLFERALVAERDFREDDARELIARLAFYDQESKYLEQWKSPARVSISSTPAGAEAVLSRIQQSERGRYSLVERRDLGSRPLDTLELAPGSYLLELSARGHVPLRFPFVVRRGDDRAFELQLPEAGTIPEGFVYVPPGEFYYGYAGSETVRVFYEAVPMHRRFQDAFAIARYETTFSDYIEFLEATPAELREPYLPPRDPNIHGTEMLLDRAADGVWELVLNPTGTRYTARAGEPIEYRERGRRSQQDWLQFPIASVSPKQASAYAAWLDQTGRVPGARLCTETEWERVARGADGRAYPWGETLNPDDANYDATYGTAAAAMGPDEVGSYPESASIFGAEDMAGNVWEWARAVHGSQPWAARGGSFYQPADTNHAANRQTVTEGFSHSTIGFRVCADSPK